MTNAQPWSPLALTLLTLAACGGEAPAGRDDAGTRDAGAGDVGTRDARAGDGRPGPDAVGRRDAGASGDGAARPDASPPPPDGERWYNLPILSPAERAANAPQGEGEQWMRGWSTTPAAAEVAVGNHDVGGPWITEDGGRSWRPCIRRGLGAYMGFAIQIDPFDAEVIWALNTTGAAVTFGNISGIYRSTDRCRSFTRVYTGKNADIAGANNIKQRWAHETFAVDPTTGPGPYGKRRIYLALPHGAKNAAGGVLLRSDAGGATGSWVEVRGLPASTFGWFAGLAAHPTRAGRLYLYGSKGLRRSDDYGATWSGNLAPVAGTVWSLDVGRSSPASGAADVLVTAIEGQRVVRSKDSGKSWATLLSDSKTKRVAVSPADAKRLYVVRKSLKPLYSADGGATWSTSVVVPIPGHGPGWPNNIGTGSSDHDYILPHAADPLRAIGHGQASIWRTSDGGKTWVSANQGFTGNKAGSGSNNAFVFDTERVDPDFWYAAIADGTLLKTEDGGLTFEGGVVPSNWTKDGPAGTPNLSNKTARSLALKPGSRDALITAVGGVWGPMAMARTGDGGASWAWINPSYSAPQNWWGWVSDKIIVGERLRSIDGGASWSALAGVDRALGWCEADHRVIWGYRGTTKGDVIVRSLDGGGTFSDFLQLSWQATAIDSRRILAPHPEEPDKLAVVGPDQEYRYYDGASWLTPKQGPLALSGAAKGTVTTIAFDPTHPNIVYAAIAPAGHDMVYRSLDHGATWQSVQLNAPCINVQHLQVHPLTGELFWGGYHGTRVLPPPAGYAYPHPPRCLVKGYPVLHDEKFEQGGNKPPR